MTYKEQIAAARYIAKVFQALSEGAEAPEKPAELPWHAVAAVAKAHSLSALVFFALKERLREELTEEQFFGWRRTAEVLNAKHLSQCAEFARLSALFEQNEILYLPMKGFLLKELYPRPELREMTDIDIYVEPENIEAALRLAESAGYTRASKNEVHHVLKKPPFIELELHEALYHEAPPLPLRGCERATGHAFRCLLPREELFAFLLRHAEKHYSSGGCGMRTVFDLYLFKKKYGASLSSKELADLLRREGLSDIHERLTALQNVWFAGSEPDESTVDFELYLVSGGTYGTLDNSVRLHSKGGRLKFVRRRVFPPYSHMRRAFPVLKKCPLLLPVFYVWRIVRSAFNGRAAANARSLGRRGGAEREIAEYKNTELNK